MEIIFNKNILSQFFIKITQLKKKEHKTNTLVKIHNHDIKN
jgi:hypothetical protein